MTPESATAPLTGGVALLERAVSYTLGTLHHVARGDLARPTPCHAWDVRALLLHLDDSLAALREAIDDGEVDRVPVAVASRPVDPIRRTRDGARGLLDVWVATGAETVSVGGCPLTTGVVSAAGALEVAVHGWDLAHACGLPRPLPEGLAEELLPLAPLLVGPADRPARFAPPLPPPATAAAGARLLAFLGRRAA